MAAHVSEFDKVATSLKVQWNANGLSVDHPVIRSGNLDQPKVIPPEIQGSQK